MSRGTTFTATRFEWSPEDIEKFISLYEQGYNIPMIADELDVSVTKVGYIANKLRTLGYEIKFRRTRNKAYNRTKNRVSATNAEIENIMKAHSKKK